MRDACARHLRDLQEGAARGLTWDTTAAERFYGFCRHVLKLNGGEFEGEAFELHPSQKFIAGSLMGWKGPDGYRRFRTAYIEQGKGNGKSPLVAAIGLYCLVADGESRAEVYAAATKKDQARILFRDAVAMVDQSPELSVRLTKRGRGDGCWNLSYEATGSFFRCLASDSAQSGPRPHCVLLDEVHEHKTPMMVDMLRAGTKGRRQALVALITNSGTDKQSVCWANHEYGTNVAAGAVDDDSYFAYICALDDGDRPFPTKTEPADESCWIKANPLLGVSIPLKYIRDQVRESIGMPSIESRVARLNFCQWVEAFSPMFSAAVYLGAQDADFDVSRLLGRRCYGGLDLSSTTDLTAFALLFLPTEDDPHYRQAVWYWMPESQFAEKERRDHVSYSAWRSGGWLEATPGKAIDKRRVLMRIMEFAERYQIEDIAYDRWRIEDFKMFMADEGVELPLVEFGQGFKDMSPAVDEYERLLISGDLKHDGNPIMKWNAASAVAGMDAAGNRKLDKKQATGRVDGLQAALMAAGRVAANVRQGNVDDFINGPVLL